MIINHVDYNNHIKNHFWGIRIQEVAFLGEDTKKQNQRKTSGPHAKHTQPERSRIVCSETQDSPFLVLHHRAHLSWSTVTGRIVDMPFLMWRDTNMLNYLKSYLLMFVNPNKEV